MMMDEGQERVQASYRGPNRWASIPAGSETTSVVTLDAASRTPI